MKIAYLCEPQIGGTFSFFTRIRPQLTALGIDFRCIPPMSAERFTETRFETVEGGDYVTFPDERPAEATNVLINHLVSSRYNAVMILPGTDRVCTNIVRYLPRTIRAVARVPMFTRGAYAPAKGLDGSLNMLVGVCDRIIDDLRDKYEISPDKLRVIYNGIDIRPIAAPKVERRPSDPFHIVFTGRLVDSHKGIFLLPDLMRRLLTMGVDAIMTIIGMGPDEKRLRELIRHHRLESRIILAGAMAMEEVEKALARADCYVLPSLYEGCPNSLLEAMAASCPVVVSRLTGSTDRIIEDGCSGWLAEVGQAGAFAEKIAWLAHHPRAAIQMGEEGYRRVASEFSIEKTAKAYANIFSELMVLADQREPRADITHYSIPKALKPTWRTMIPDPVKNVARTWLERFGVSS